MEPIVRPRPEALTRSTSQFSEHDARFEPGATFLTQTQSSWFQMLQSWMCTLRPERSKPSVLAAASSRPPWSSAASFQRTATSQCRMTTSSTSLKSVLQ